MAADRALALAPKDGRRWDLVALGEVLLRLDPGDERITTARSFRAWEGGGEYNVARNAARCFRLDTAIVTAFADNPVGRLLEDMIRQGGVDSSLVRWVAHDGVGRTTRNGLYFGERGFGLRAPLASMDRGHTAIAQLRPGDVDWDEIFGARGARWFHTGGIFCGLSEGTPQVAREALQAARRHGVVVSYDLNYRESLWRSSGGKARAQEVNRELLPEVDVLFGLTPESGLVAAPAPAPGRRLDTAAARQTIEKAVAEFPNLKVLATTLRDEHSASRHDGGALCYAGGRFFEAARRDNLEVLDRIGAGDGFAAGVIYGLLAGKDPQYAIDCGAALGALTMTTPGDTAMATLAEVEAVMQGARPTMSR
jgi:2-dehydro-3-deoxygluconokinase